MATKKDEHDGVFLFLIVPAVLATLVFSLYYFSRLKKQYLTGPHARRIFDIGAQGTSLLVSGVLGYLTTTRVSCFSVLTRKAWTSETCFWWCLCCASSHRWTAYR